MTPEQELQQKIDVLRARLGANQLILLALMAQLKLKSKDILAIRKNALEMAEFLNLSAQTEHQVHADRAKMEIDRIMGNFSLSPE